MLAVSLHASSDPTDIVRAFWSNVISETGPPSSPSTNHEKDNERDKKLAEFVLEAVAEFEGIDNTEGGGGRPSSEQIGKLAGDVQGIWRVMIGFYKCVSLSRVLSEAWFNGTFIEDPRTRISQRGGRLCLIYVD